MRAVVLQMGVSLDGYVASHDEPGDWGLPPEHHAVTAWKLDSLRQIGTHICRLNTDYLDLLQLHAWDGLTPVEEILRAMDDLVSAGKVVYLGISDTPAWQVSRMQAIAELRGWAPLIALQIEYSLIERTVERDLIPMAAELGLGVLLWSPLASGVLSGKYTHADLAPREGAELIGSRREIAAGNGYLTERSLAIADVVKQVAAEHGCSPSRVAIAWTLTNPAVTAPIIGARTLAQLEDNLGALDVELTESQLAALDKASAVELGFPHSFLAGPMIRSLIFGGATIRPRA